MSISTEHRVRVVLADDHVVVRQGVTTLLENEGFDVVGQASDGRAVVELCDELQPDVAVLDVAMPLSNGIEAAREILKRRPDVRVVLLTMYHEESFVAAGLQAGVAGFVLKSNTVTHLVEAIDAVMKNGRYLGPGVSQIVVDAYLSHTAAPADPLSDRERQVLQLIAEGMNMKEVGGVLGISGRTAETHRAHIMHKLNIRDIAGLVRYAIARGLVECSPVREPGGHPEAVDRRPA